MDKVKLGDICTLKSSKRIFEDEYVECGIPFIRGLEISDGSLKDKDSDFECYISQERYEELKKDHGVPEVGDILITAVGTIGNLFLVEDDFRFYFKDGNVIWMNHWNKDVYPEYLYFYLQSPYFKKQLDYALIGAVQKALTIVMLKDIEVILPSLDEQKKIVSVLESLDDKITNNKKIIKELESTARLIYDYWFMQFDFPDENGKPYRSSGGKMVWNEELKREIPEGWHAERLNDLVSVEKGISYKSEDLLGDGIPMINLASFNADGSYKSNGLKFFSGTVNTERIVKPLDLIMCVTQQTAIDLTGKTNVIGKAILVPNVFDKNDVVVSTDVVKLVCNDSEDIKFLLLGLFKRPEIHKYIVGYGNGTKIKHLDVASAFDLTIAIPTLDGDVLSNFAQIIGLIECGKSNLLNQINSLERIKSWLLPMLMNGQVQVN